MLVRAKSVHSIRSHCRASAAHTGGKVEEIWKQLMIVVTRALVLIFIFYKYIRKREDPIQKVMGLNSRVQKGIISLLWTLCAHDISVSCIMYCLSQVHVTENSNKTC